MMLPAICQFCALCIQMNAGEPGAMEAVFDSIAAEWNADSEIPFGDDACCAHSLAGLERWKAAEAAL